MRLLLLLLRLIVELVCGVVLAIAGAATLVDNLWKFFDATDCMWQLLVLCIGMFLLWDTWRLAGQMPDRVRGENASTISRGKW